MLRDYQQIVYDNMKNKLHFNKNVICQMPCRSGKSYLMLQVCQDAKRKGSNVLILAHRNLLLKQHSELINLKHVRIENVFTEVRHLGENGKVDIILCDECHLSAADTYRTIFDYYSNAIIIGFTATPCRLDGRPLGDIYQDIIKGPSVKELIEKKCISPFDHYAPRLNIDMSKVKNGDGDYNQTDLEKAMMNPKIYGDIVKNYEKLAKDKQAVAYCVSIAHAEKICELFTEAGYRSECIHSHIPMKERENILERFKNKEITILVSVNTISEGITLPSCEVCLMLRPTQSYALYMQQGMRALTPQQNKRAIIIDYVGNVFRHGSIDSDTEWSLVERKKCRNPSGEEEVISRQCSNCFRVYEGNNPICPYCGYNNGKTRKQLKEEHDAELERVQEIAKKEKRKEVGRSKNFEDLCRIALERHYKPGWVLGQANRKGIEVDWWLYRKLKEELE
jgi:superfamily II DNA or RNA helicase